MEEEVFVKARYAGKSLPGIIVGNKGTVFKGKKKKKLSQMLVMNGGRLTSRISINKNKKVSHGRLILESFDGQPPENYDIFHHDEDVTDCRVENLVFVPHSWTTMRAHYRAKHMAKWQKEAEWWQKIIFK